MSFMVGGEKDVRYLICVLNGFFMALDCFSLLLEDYLPNHKGVTKGFKKAAA